MQEYVTEAVMLNKQPVRDVDARYSFFSKRFGKISGKATSSRKITSKLAGHLEPGNLVQIRFVETGGTQIVDALKKKRLNISLKDLGFLYEMLPEGEPEADLWEELIKNDFSWRNALAILGWDPKGAVCEICGKPATHFFITRQEFFCATCASKLPANKLILL